MEQKYDVNYSLTIEETDKMYEWQKKHNKKFHKKEFRYRGVSPVSDFEVRFGSCSIGTWAECVCLNCLNKINDNNENVEKVRKLATFEVRELE